MAAQDKIPTVGFVSLGCAKNLVDTERLSSALVAMGYATSPDYQSCDAVIVNTCGFINPAIEESLDAIGEALSSNAKVIVTGCLGRNAELVRERCPQVAAVVGPGLRASVIRELEKAVGKPPQEARQRLPESGILLTPPHYAYLKIAEGCRHRCTFCIIPSLRGPLRSRDPESILKEARDLKRRGVKELIVIAQDSSDYGIDLAPKSSLSALLLQLSELGLWVRVHYVYPSPEADRAVELMGKGLVLPYLDVPLQHVALPLLKAMRRPGGAERALDAVRRWRSICPDLCIRSTFITGFPGETESMFGELLDFLKEARLDRVGCFPYSGVEGAEANDLPGSVDPEVREERAKRLMDLQAEISYSRLEERMGKTYDVIVDSVSEDGTAAGRTKYESPDVDGTVLIKNAAGVREGSIVRAVMTGHDEHDLEAVLAPQEGKKVDFQRI
jgi:ribosomal protein S12 methylthiotransferase